MVNFFRRFSLLMLILLVVGTGCGLPTLPLGASPTAEMEEEPFAVQEQPTQLAEVRLEQQEALPPALVETDPVPGSTIKPDQEFLFYFNQPVVKGSVESALQVEPASILEFDWVDDQTLAVSLEEPLALEQSISFRLAADFQAENGLTAQEEREVTYQTAGPLLLVDRFPKDVGGFVDPTAVVMVAFNQPVVPLGEESELSAFTLSPDAPGTGEWLNTSTYIFTPDPALGGGVEYTLTLNEDLQSLWGASLMLTEDQAAEWSFRTSEPRLLDTTPKEEATIPIDQEFELRFNQPMDVETVTSSLVLEDQQGNPVAAEISWRDDFSVFFIKPVELLARSSQYRINLEDSIRSYGGTELTEDTTISYQTVGDLAVTSVTPSLSSPLQIYNGYTSIQVHFNAPLADTDFAEVVEFEPALIDPVYYFTEQNTLVISGYFRGSTNYVMTISESLTDKWGGTLGAPYENTFATSAVRSQLAVPLLQYGQQILFTHPQNIFLQAQAVNLSGVNIRTTELSLETFIRYAINQEQRIDNLPQENLLEGDVESWREAFGVSSEVSEAVEIPLTREDELEPGVYAYQLDAPEVDIKPQPFLLVVGDTHITLKRSETQLFAWVVDLAEGEPLTGARLGLHYSEDGEAASCTTDIDGRCIFSLPENLDPYQPLVVVHSSPGEDDFGIGTDRWTMGISGWDFNLPTSRYQPEFFAYLYTDRPIYQPGQEVNFRVILRNEDNARYSIPDLGQVIVEVYGDYQVTSGGVPLLESIPVSLSDYGSGTGVFRLSEDAAPGSYSLRIPDIENSFLNFTVSEYRKPEVELQVAFQNQELLQGEDLQAEIHAGYYFGAPAANKDVHWVLFVQPESFDLPFGYQAGDQAFYWINDGYPQRFYQTMGSFITEGEARTDQTGRLDLQIPYAEIQGALNRNALQRLNLEVTLEDESGFAVSARSSMFVHPEHYYIGVRPEQWSGTAGQPLGFAIQTAGWEKTPVPGVALTAVLNRVRWVETVNPVSGFSASTPEFTPVNSVDLTTDEQGQARVELTPDEPGTYLLEVTGGSASTQVMVWTGGSGNVSWPALPNQQIPLTLDKEVYQAGETAALLIPNPFEQALALITVERSNVMRSYVVQTDQPALEFTLPIQVVDAPNIYASVTLLKVNDDNSLDFRQGYVNIPVEPASLVLDVNLSTDAAIQDPGGEVIFSVQVNDLEGNPVEGEFSLALIDKAVLALSEPNAEDILDAFYGTQPLRVHTGLALAAYLDRFPRPSADGIGGGGEAGPGVRYLRETFRDTAYWNGSIRTDVDGRADIQVALPDNLTTWVANLRGLTMDSRVGEAQTEVVVSKALLVRPVVPRFLVAADEVQIGAVLHNNTAESLPVEVSLQASGISLSEETQEMQRVIVNAGSTLRVNWWGTVQSVDQVELVFSAQAGQLSDSTIPEAGAIPVLHYSAPQTFGTSGVLTEAGEILEVVSFPRSYEIQGGNLTVEMAPSLAAAVLEEMQIMESYPGEFTEAIVSRLLPNLEMLRAIQLFNLNPAVLEDELTDEIRNGLDRLSQMQDASGGWGWTVNEEPDVYISSYVLLGLIRAAEYGFFIEADVLTNAQDYLLQSLFVPSDKHQTWELDRLVLQRYALYLSGITDLQSRELMEVADRLNPWSRALLYLMRADQEPGSQTTASALNDLQSSAKQTSTGVQWFDAYPTKENFSSNIFNTAVVVYALAKLDPASSLLPGGVRTLISHRLPSGGWSNSYEAAWSLMALIEVMKATGEFQSDFDFSAMLNGENLISGTAQGLDQVTSVVAVAPFEELFLDSPNALRLQKGSGVGKLYYRAYLQADFAVEDAVPVQRGLALERRYTLWSQDCAADGCPEVIAYDLSDTDRPVFVHITLTVPEEMQYVIVEDWIPAGAEIVNTGLLTTQQGIAIPPEGLLEPLDVDTPIFPNWLFGTPQIFDDHIRWSARHLPAGMYELTYRFTPSLAGSYRTIPARAYQYYFPEVEATSSGNIFTITP